MTWDFCSKDDVVSFSGISESDIEDSWIDEVQDMIRDKTGIEYGDATSYTEDYDGNGTPILFLKHAPVTSVSSLSIDGSALSSSQYEVYDDRVKLVQSSGTKIQESLGLVDNVFPNGQNNISISYSVGATVPGRVKFCAILMVTTIATVAKRGGSDAIIPITRREREYGASSPSPLFGLAGKLNDIMDNMLDVKVSFR